MRRRRPRTVCRGPACHMRRSRPCLEHLLRARACAPRVPPAAPVHGLVFTRARIGPTRVRLRVRERNGTMRAQPLTRARIGGNARGRSRVQASGPCAGAAAHACRHQGHCIRAAARARRHQAHAHARPPTQAGIAPCARGRSRMGASAPCEHGSSRGSAASQCARGHSRLSAASQCVRATHWP